MESSSGSQLFNLLTFETYSLYLSSSVKCHWFDPNVMRTAPEIGQVEIRQDSIYQGEDVYIVAQQATQVYYLPWACQKDPNLIGWYLVQLVSPHGKLPVPNDEDYNFDPNTREFYQPEGLEGRFDIDMFSLMGMEVDNDIDQDDGDEDDREEVQNAKDLQMLERLQLGDDNDDNDGDEPDLLDKGKATAPEVTYNPADGPEAYTIASVHSKLSEYTSAACERHGGDFDPATQPLDTDLLMRMGGGKQHDQY